jgi:hypothetical protein
MLTIPAVVYVLSELLHKGMFEHILQFLHE